MNETVWERRECVSANVEDSMVLLDLETLVYHSLNSTASAIWDLLETPNDEAAMVEALCRKYKVSPEQCRASVGKLLQQLAESKLIAPLKSQGEPILLPGN